MTNGNTVQLTDAVDAYVSEHLLATHGMATMTGCHDRDDNT